MPKINQSFNMKYKNFRRVNVYRWNILKKGTCSGEQYDRQAILKFRQNRLCHESLITSSGSAQLRVQLVLVGSRLSVHGISPVRESSKRQTEYPGLFSSASDAIRTNRTNENLKRYRSKKQSTTK